MNFFVKLFGTLAGFVIAYHLVSNRAETEATNVTKERFRNGRRVEDYSFEGELDRATEECSYAIFANSLINKNKTIQQMKNEINRKRVTEFYRQREEEKKRSKEYYENVERESRRRIMLGNSNPGWILETVARSPNSPVLPATLPMPDSILGRNFFKRSLRSKANRKNRFLDSFTRPSFRDHNNCTSRCIFSRMEMVNSLGFPQESLISKHFEDKIRNKRVRLSKIRRVTGCFKSLQKVALEDSCIFSREVFDCLNLGDRTAWSVQKRNVQ